MTAVLDSWAILRLLEGTEPAATRVQSLIDSEPSPVMNWINLGEVFYVIRRDQDAQQADQVVRDLRPLVQLDRPTEERVLQAAAIKADHRMAYADAFAAATAIAYDAQLVTGDPELLVSGAPWQWVDLRTIDGR